MLKNFRIYGGLSAGAVVHTSLYYIIKKGQGNLMIIWLVYKNEDKFTILGKRKKCTCFLPEDTV